MLYGFIVLNKIQTFNLTKKNVERVFVVNI